MYQGKHVANVQPAVRRPATRRPAARRSGKRKATVLLSSLALLIALAVGTTAAFLITNDEPIVNTFNPSKVTSSVNEDFNGAVKSNVTVANTGDTEAYIRATYVVTWKDVNGQVYGKVPQPGVDYDITIGSGWIHGSDGYYYYVSPVAPSASTTALIVSCAPVDERTPEGFGLNVEILGSAIQSTPVKVVNESWKVVYAATEHGNLAAATAG